MNELLRRSRIIIADGGMGTQLQAAGLMPGECGELWNIERPDAVRAIHRAYAEAGAEILLTNTFGASAIALGRHGLGARAREVNTAAAALAVNAVSQPPNAECPPSQPWVLG